MKKRLYEIQAETTTHSKTPDIEKPRIERRRLLRPSLRETTAAGPPSSDLPPLGDLQAPGAFLPSDMARNGFPDIEQLRLTQDFSSPANTKKMLLTVEVRKPNRQEFFRVRPGAEWQLATYVLEVKERQKRELYLVHSDLWEELRADIVARILFTTINRAGVVFLWPVGLPNKDGSFNHWFRSAYEAAQLAMTTWVRATSDTDRCVYDIYKANGDLPDPEWPEEDFQTLVHRAFKNRFIATTKHPVLRRLRGER